MRLLARQNHEPLQKSASKQGLERYLGSSLKGEAAIDWDDRRPAGRWSAKRSKTPNPCSRWLAEPESQTAPAAVRKSGC